MLENIKAQWTSSTLVPLLFVAFFVWQGVRTNRVNTALLTDYHQHHLEQVSFGQCDTLGLRAGEVFPALCRPAIQQIGANYAHQYTGRNFDHKGAGQVFYVDDRVIQYNCYDIACRVSASYPDREIAGHWSEARHCWLDRPSEASSWVENTTINGSPSAGETQGSSLPAFKTVEAPPTLGQLAATNC